MDELPRNPKRIGYLVPEFPGQTHIFFWRELAVLAAQNVHAELVSTRRPPLGIVSHDWSADAVERTQYLSPLGPRGLMSAALELMRSGPLGWLRAAVTIARSETALKGRIRLVGLVLAGARLATLARTSGWHHVHVHSCGDAAHVAMFAKLLSGLPYSLTLHGPLRDYGPNQRLKWRDAAFAIVITRTLYTEVRRELQGDLPPVLEIAPMGVDIRSFRRRRPYTPWTGTGPWRIFSCGRLNPCKGHADLIRAAAQLRKRGRDVQLSIAGEDEAGGTGYHAELENLITQLGLQGSVHLLGAVSEEAIRTALEEAHVFALASLEEPLGVAIMEAMAMSVPVVVTGAGGVPELVDDGVDGVLVRPEQPQELADEIERVLIDGTYAQRLGMSAHAKVASSFDSRRSAEMLNRLLTEAA